MAAARMVDVSEKEDTFREAIAEGRVCMLPETLRLILGRNISKGDVLGIARITGIMAAKRTSDFIPLCHPLNLASVEISFEQDRKASCVNIRAAVRSTGKTGVEMEALTTVSAAGLAIYDMCKAADRTMTVTGIQLMKKTGGKSGTFERKRTGVNPMRGGQCRCLPDLFCVLLGIELLWTQQKTNTDG